MPKTSHIDAISIANRFLLLIQHNIIKAEIAGALRRQCKHVSKIVIVCIDNPRNPLSNLFQKGYKPMLIDGMNMKEFKYPKDNLYIELYIAQAYDYGRILAIRTGSSSFVHIKLSTIWNRKGYVSTSSGLRRKIECERKGRRWVLREEYKHKPTSLPNFISEYDFFNFLAIDYILPQDRNWIAKTGQLNK